ncbi:MAG: glycoside hydrolase family 11 protein [Lachnospiraceae bacterium]|nr:glycoside hydrolase family 11 protein [Lachnospiraceae bacterium]
MSKKLKGLLLALVLCLQVVVPATTAEAATVLTDNATGTQDGYNYELWKDYGTTSMTLNSGGTFDCSWSNIGNALFRKGIKFDCTKTYSQIGNISVNYGVNYQPNGNSYLCVYGWSRSPLVEYYIVESWGTWRPPGATSKGTITVDGGTYDVYETTRVDQPSIDGNTTFQQYWSVRTSKRTSGTISVTEHFKAWENMGMSLGLIYEAALTVEGYQSSGQASVYTNTISVGGSSSSGSSSSGSSSSGSSSSGSTSSGEATVVQCENMTITGQYAGTISSPFTGVALYANNESCSYTQYFASSTHNFTLRGCSNNSEMAKIDLVIGGETKGTFYYGGSSAAEYTIENVSHGTGDQKIELKVTADDGSWDGYIDYLSISGGSGSSSSGSSSSGSSSSGNTSSGNTSSGNTSSGNTSSGNTSSGTTSGSDTVVECETMTKSGQYTGNVSSPFTGVALYANNDAVSYTQYFGSGSHDFTLRGASNNSTMAKVDLVIGGSTVGTFYFGDSNVAEYTIKNVSHGTGNQTVKLVVTADDGNWDAYIDSLTISAAGSSTNTNSGNSGNTSSGNTSSGTTSTPSKMVALTFDDGPSTTTTTQILDVLDNYGVKATFFLIGQQINSSTQSILQRQNSSGHELANHSYTHSDMTSMSWSTIQSEISQTNNLINSYTGQTPKFFRPPYISVNSTMYSAIDMAFVQGIMCNDWEDSTSASQRANTVLSSVSNGSIVLLHDYQGNSQTVQALPTIIEGLKNQGYTFVTMSQLFSYAGKTANVDNKLWSNVYN